MDFQRTPVAQAFPMNRKVLYENTPFEVYEDDDSDYEQTASRRSSSGSFDGTPSGKSYLTLDFEDGEFSPCDTEHGYGIMHPEEQHGRNDSLWYDDQDIDDASSDDASFFADQTPSMTNSVFSLSGEDTEGIRTPTSGDEEIDVDRDEDAALEPVSSKFDYDQAAIEDLRESLTRHLPPTSNGSAYFEMMVAEALSSLDSALRDAPANCFEEMCWESHSTSPPPLDGARRASTVGTRRDSKFVRFAPSKRVIDVPEEVTPSFEPDWGMERHHDLLEFGYKYTIPSPSQDIGFSPRTSSSKKQMPTSGSFKRLAKHLRIAH